MTSADVTTHHQTRSFASHMLLVSSAWQFQSSCKWSFHSLTSMFLHRSVTVTSQSGMCRSRSGWETLLWWHCSFGLSTQWTISASWLSQWHRSDSETVLCCTSCPGRPCTGFLLNEGKVRLTAWQEMVTQYLKTYCNSQHQSNLHKDKRNGDPYHNLVPDW